MKRNIKRVVKEEIKTIKDLNNCEKYNKNMKNTIKGEKNIIREICGKIKRRDFSGNTGKAIKNSSWQITTTLTAKIGFLFFTIVTARLMLQEIYGL